MGYKINVKPEKLSAKIYNPEMMLYAHTRLYAYCNDYVPYRTGRLAKDVRISEKGVLYLAPYAANCYYGNWNFRKDHHQLATNYWNEYMWHDRQDEYLEEIRQYIVQRL